MFEYYRMEIIPGQRSEILLLKPIPAQFTNPVVYGRFYYRTIFDTCHSSGFIYRIPLELINFPIKPPSNNYIEQQDESAEEADPF